jgi:hypothetical protein
LSNFGQQLQPEISPELEAKISQNITDAMQKIKNFSSLELINADNIMHLKTIQASALKTVFEV